MREFLAIQPFLRAPRNHTLLRDLSQHLSARVSFATMDPEQALAQAKITLMAADLKATDAVTKASSIMMDTQMYKVAYLNALAQAETALADAKKAIAEKKDATAKFKAAEEDEARFSWDLYYSRRYRWRHSVEPPAKKQRKS